MLTGNTLTRLALAALLGFASLPAVAGNTSSSDPHGFPPPPCPCTVGTGNPAGSSQGVDGAAGGGAGTTPGGATSSILGMPSYSISPMLISLSIADTPLAYKPPKGPAIKFSLSYNQLDIDQPATFTYSNVGFKWTHNWIGYVQDDPNAAGSRVLVYLSGGPGRLYKGFNASSGTFTPEQETGAQLVKVSASPLIYERRFPDGRKDVFAASDNSSAYPRRVFLSQRIDAKGNTVTLAYDGQTRLTSVMDAIGQLTEFHYDSPAQPLRLTSVDDPFGRSVSLDYDSNGRLSGITDAIGMTSSFTYDSGNSITAMTTPYGTTSFVTGHSGMRRWINATDPNGHTSRMEFNQSVAGIPFSESLVPVGINAFNRYINSRDSFYWDARAYAEAAGDYSKALTYHWSHATSGGRLSSVTSDSLESVKYPLESRIWYNHPGDIAGGSGTLNFPSRIGRVLPDGSTQLTRNTYNVLGNPTQNIDPTGLVTDITYAGNGIDALTITRHGSGYTGTESFTYNNQHQPLTHTDELGGVTVYSYNGAGQKVSETDPQGNTEQWSYDSNGYLVTTTDANGHATTYTYDAVGRIANKTDAAGYATSYTYDALNRVLRTTYWDDTYELETYDKLDRVAHRNRLGEVTTYAYDNARNLISVTDPMGHATTYIYYPNNLVKIRTDANGGVTQWQRDLEGRVSSRTDPNGGIAQFVYDSSDRLVSMTNALGHVTTVTLYDAMGRPLRIKDVNGVLTDFTYSPRGWLSSRTVRASPVGLPGVGDAVSTFSYDALGERITAIDPDAVSTSYVYDAAHRVTAVADALDNYVMFTLDAKGNPLAEIRAHGNDAPTYSVTRQFNAVDELSQTQDAQGRGTSYAYDGDRNPIQTTNPLGIVTRTNFDALNRVVATIENSNGIDLATKDTTTRYSFDAANHLVRVIDPDNLMTSYTVDPLGHVLQLNSPDTGVTSKAYDSAGRLTSATDARGITASYSYDALSRLTAINYVDASQNVAYHYGDASSITGCSSSFPTGRLTRFVQGDGAGTTYCYNRRGDVTVKRQTQASGTTDTTQYFYTLGDRLQQIIYPSGNTALYAHDGAGRISKIDLSNVVAFARAPGGGTASVMSLGATAEVAPDAVSDIEYLPFGPLSRYVLGYRLITPGSATLGHPVNRTYDGNYWLTSIDSVPLNLDFTRDAVGAVTGVSGGATATAGAFDYDPLHRIKGQRVQSHFGLPISTESYTYNATGDRTSKAFGSRHPSSPTDYIYAANTHHLVAVGSAPRTYDAAGNTTTSVSSGETFGFTYSARGRLSSVQRNGQSVADYTYNALGQRTSKTDTSAQTLPQRFVYDESGHLLGEYGDQSREYVWLGDVPVAVVDTSGPAKMVNYIVADGLGTPRAVITNSGTVLWQWAYAGNAFEELQPTSSTGYVLNLRSAGEYYDAETGLNSNGYRTRESATWRFLQSDPIGLAGGISTYAAVGNNPLSYTDALGLRDVVVAVWTMDIGAGSVGHVFVGEMNGDTILSQFPHGPGGQSVPEGPNNTLSWSDTLREEKRPPDAIYKVNVSDDFGFDYVAKANRDMALWNWHPHEYSGGKTNCTVAAQEAFEDGGVPVPRPSINPLLTPNAFKSGLDALIQNGNPNVTRISNVPWN